MILTRQFDVILPFRTDAELLLSKKLDYDVLERHYWLPVIMPLSTTIRTFTDKSSFAAWLIDNGLGAFTPKVYQFKHQVKFPALVKFVAGTWGNGIYLANDMNELHAAIAKQKGVSILVEAVVGIAEPAVHFIARRGKLLALHCIVHVEKEDLFVTGDKHVITAARTVDCRDFDAISPLTMLISRIVNLSQYNGFGFVLHYEIAALVVTQSSPLHRCFNFKFAPYS